MNTKMLDDVFFLQESIDCKINNINTKRTKVRKYEIDKNYKD